jgi:arylsulfatase A-like enzyme
MVKEGHERIMPALQEGYQKSITKADRFLAKIMNLVEQAGLAEKTLVVVTGDHGDSFNEHGEINQAIGGRYEHGQFLYDNVLRVPLIFFCGGRKLSRVFDAQIQEVDIAPTLLEALGVDYQGSMDGRSLWRENIIKGVSPEETYAFSEVVRKSLDIELRCVRSGSYKLIRDYKRDTYELYDLKADSGERRNLYTGNESNEKAILLEELKRYSECQDTEQATYSEDERQAIEKTLCNLGYMD